MNDDREQRSLYDTTVEAAFSRFQGHFDLYRAIRKDVDRIQDLVQNNPAFFDASWGVSCMKLAADKLEKLVALSKEIKR